MIVSNQNPQISIAFFDADLDQLIKVPVVAWAVGESEVIPVTAYPHPAPWALVDEAQMIGVRQDDSRANLATIEAELRGAVDV